MRRLDTQRVHGHDYYERHYPESLRKVLRDDWPPPLDDSGRPKSRKWMNCLGRLVDTTCAWNDHGLSKAKIEDRANHLTFADSAVCFTIERHPVGRVTEQRWRFDIESLKLTMDSERVLKSDYRWNEELSRWDCPNCGQELEVYPGRAKCVACSFEDLYEHSW